MQPSSIVANTYNIQYITFHYFNAIIPDSILAIIDASFQLLLYKESWLGISYFWKLENMHHFFLTMNFLMVVYRMNAKARREKMVMPITHDEQPKTWKKVV